MLDPRHHAVRSDLADIRLADQVFAPHYAVAIDCEVAMATDLRAAHDAASGVIGRLVTGDRFELIDVIGDIGWGIAVAQDLVGYVPVAALAKDGR